MPRFVEFTTNFATGELDPLLRARVDLQAYNNALAKATNVLIQPQGGLRRRPGTKHIFELPNASAGAANAANGVRLVPFQFSVADSYMLCFTHNRMHVIKNGAVVANINATGNSYLTTTISSDIVDDMCWTQSADTLIVVHPDLQPVRITRTSDSAWTAASITFDSIPKYAYTLTTTTPTSGHLTPSAVSGNVTLTSQNSAFSAGSVNQYINATPQGRARIVEYVSNTVVKAVTEYPFFDTSNIAQGNWEIESGYVDVWSSTKGWPRTVTFHEGRLYFGGSKSRPSTVWGSKIGLFFDFVPSESLDDDAVEATLDTNDLNVITDIISSRDFQVFTTGGEFYVPQQGTDPVTPLTFTFKNVSRNGIKPGTRVQSVESGSIYIQRQGKSLNEFVFSDTQLTYITQRISLLSGHLLKGPQRVALRKASSTEEADLLLMTNTDDGSMAVFSIMRSQQVTSPSEFTTDGFFIDVGVDVNAIYVVTWRSFNGVNRYFIELFDYAYFTDCAFVGGAAASASGLPHVAKALNVITDGSPQSNETVSGGGSVTFDRASTTSYEVGLPINVYVKTMPAEVKLQTGSRVSFKKRIVEISAVVNKTQNMIINNQPVAFRLFDNPLLDDPLPEFTGIKRVNGVLGYSREQFIEVSQDLPVKMNLLGLDYRVAVFSGT
ncbi:hypothetical protein UFOVP628_20 [uncultured Caudovirales phage]|uniref:Ubiquitin-activating enzyme E1, FCCH domain containing protein n=1 Tax=uncultured Caudovirales phage TaxID=2100421 RepID=A0A6J5N9D8_9CAUD|nr:hypothetical protein UFOVP628_20 [uncultured Caudovirales phage]